MQQAPIGSDDGQGGRRGMGVSAVLPPPEWPANRSHAR